jgi:hypothetical protein
MSKTQEPKILSSPATGRYYLVTKYKTAGEGFSALEKIDITDELQQLLVKSQLDELQAIRDIKGETVDAWASPAHQHILERIEQLNKEKSV